MGEGGGGQGVRWGEWGDGMRGAGGQGVRWGHEGLVGRGGVGMVEGRGWDGGMVDRGCSGGRVWDGGMGVQVKKIKVKIMHKCAHVYVQSIIIHTVKVT